MNFFFQEEIEDLEREAFETVNKAFKILNRVGLGTQFHAFFSLIVENKFPLDNISMLLFLETVRFYDCDNTSQMRYLEETRRFWKSGFRLFHAKFLYFMGGPKHVGELSQADSKGFFKPENARINFAVPSVNTLEQFMITYVEMPNRMPAGIIQPVLDSIADAPKNLTYMLCADGKKVTAGIDKIGGDVDMFGFEDKLTLSERKARLEKELMIFSGILLDLYVRTLCRRGHICRPFQHVFSNGAVMQKMY